MKLDLSRIDVREGDCRDVLRDIPDASFDAACMDPPYALVSVVQRFGNSPRSEATENAANPYGRTGRGFMGKKWDTGEVAHDVAFWREVRRVLKPGAHLVAFAGTRTYHRLACAIEDAGFEIRDMVGWLYGSGFPKSHDAGEGRGTALKPAQEPTVLARVPLIGTVAENIARYGTGAINIDGCRVGDEVRVERPQDFKRYSGGRLGDPSVTEPVSHLPSKTYVGRWPANVVHDGSPEVLAAFPDADGQRAAVGPQHGAKASVHCYGDFGPRDEFAPRGDTGSAARFFYCAKAGPEDRFGSKHPTVKPVALLRWLLRLIVPPGGQVLDCFAGTGTTGLAALAEGLRATLIERDPEYLADINARLAWFADGGHSATLRARHKTKAADDLPLFKTDDIQERSASWNDAADPGPQDKAPQSADRPVEAAPSPAAFEPAAGGETLPRTAREIEDDLLEIPAFLKRDPATGRLLGAAG